MMGEPPLKAVENVSVRPKQRIPGEVKAMGGHRHEVNKVHDISKKNILELKDLIARHESLLKNKKLLATLPDKGEKIKEKLETAKELLKSRTVEVQDAADLFATLSINGKKVTPEEMEWKFGGGVMSRLTKPVVSQEPLDSDDDEAGEENPLKILAEKEALGKSSRRNQERNVPASESFEDKHTHKVAFKGDSAEVKSRFMPFNSVKNESLKDTENVGLKRRVITKDHKKVELMPLPNEDHKRELKLVSIEESLKIQRNQEKILKDLQIKNAMEKLREGRLPGLSDLTEVPDAVIAKLASEMSYRDPGNNSGGEEDHTSEHGEEEDAANDEPDYENPINS